MRSSARVSFVSIVAGLVALVGLSQPAHAVFTQYSSRATFDALGPYIGVDWGVFGPAGTLISTPDSQVVSGLTIGVSSSQGQLLRHDDDTDITSRFLTGERLLADGGSQSDTFIVRFGTDVRGFGTQIDSHYINGAYTGGIDVFSATNVLLYTAAFSGDTSLTSTLPPFVGVTSSLGDISYAYFFIDQPGFFPDKAGSLLINRLDVLTVPEPASLVLFTSALLGFFGMGFLRRKQS